MMTPLQFVRVALAILLFALAELLGLLWSLISAVGAYLDPDLFDDEDDHHYGL